jgi:hypothetical protein
MFLSPAKIKRLAELMRLAVPGLCVMPDIGSWRAPYAMAAFASVIHEREGAEDPESDCRQNNQQRGFHSDLATAAPDPSDLSNYRASKMNPK